MAKCEKCGAKLHKKATFCFNCGEKVELPLEAATQKKGISVWMLILSVALALVIGVGGGWLLSGLNGGGSRQVDADSENDDEDKRDEHDVGEVGDKTPGQTVTSDDKEKEDSKTPEQTVTSDDKEGDSNQLTYYYGGIEAEVIAKQRVIQQKYPEAFRGRMYLDALDGMLEGDSEEIRDYNYFGIHFLKSQPRDIKLIGAIWLEECYSKKAQLLKYTDDFSVLSEMGMLPEDAFYQESDYVVGVKKEYLSTLEPGYYKIEFLFQGSVNASHTLLIVIHDEGDMPANYRPDFSTGRGYYSAEVNNDVYFYMNGSTTPVRKIIMKGSELDSNCYGLTDDGYGIVFYKEFLQMYTEDVYLSMTVVTEQNLMADLKIIFLNHADDIQ